MLSRFFLLFGRLNDNCGAKNGFFEGKMQFFENFSSKCLQVRKKAVPLHRFWKTRDIGRLAQLVQSICLTSRGSAVRIRQRPQQKQRVSWEKEFRAFSSAGSEHLPYKQRVGGSNPSTPTEILKITRKGRLAQLVQSICLTSRGSAVRIRQRPPNIAEWSSW